MAGVCGLLLAAGLALSACSPTPQVSAAGTSGSAPAAGQAGVQGSTGGTAAEPGASEPSGQGGLQVLDFRDTTDGSVPVRVELNDVRVRGQIMWVTITARNLATEGNSWQVNGFFGRPNSLSASGLYLVDSVQAKRYLPGENPDGDCVCTDGLSGAFADPGQGVVINAAFAAPPPEVTELDLFVPNVQPFMGVQVNR
jgi:hypothetical protein